MGVLEERARVEKEIAGLTVAHALRETAERHPDAPAFTQGEETLTWGRARREVLRIAAAFTALGLEPGDTVALMMPNRTEHVELTPTLKLRRRVIHAKYASAIDALYE